MYVIIYVYQVNLRRIKAGFPNGSKCYKYLESFAPEVNLFYIKGGVPDGKYLLSKEKT